MAKTYGDRLITVVAQEQFEVQMNRYCKLVPRIYFDGDSVNEDDFPNDGELWWSLQAHTEPLAEPGRLISCHAEIGEPGQSSYDDTKSRYRAQWDSVRELKLREDGLEVLGIPFDDLESVRDIVAGGYRLQLDHRPTSTVLLRWRHDIYGPFIVSVDSSQVGPSISMSFAPSNTDMTVYQISSDVFHDKIADSHLVDFSTTVSRSPQHRKKCSNLITIKHALLLTLGYEEFLTHNQKKLSLEPVDRKLIRFAKRCLTRKKRQELRTLLNDLEVTGDETEDAGELVEAVASINQVMDRQDTALDIVSKAMLESGILGEDRLRRAEKEYTDKYVQDRTAELQAKIEATIKAKRQDLHEVERSLDGLKSRMRQEESDQRAEFQKKFDKAEEKITKAQTELQRQKKLLKDNLQTVTRELRDAGDDVVNRFLAIAPLLSLYGSTSMIAPGSPAELNSHVAVSGERRQPHTFELPLFISSPSANHENQLSEEEFFQKFRDIVKGSGFSYRLVDLQRFHMSVKCGEITVLGGAAGTGKSSLPPLYAQALLGIAASTQRIGCLMVNINPSWMDVRDLLGHMNTLDQTYYPAESGLFQHLVFAQEEYSACGTSTGLYLTCLDEMNLSQVEHYFSDFMMALERRGDARAIQCFAAEVVTENCPFRKWARLTLAPSLRFVGTVNFDETTRLLSDRFLDRINLIGLSSGSLPDISPDDEAVLQPSGRMITLSDFQSWQRDTALPPEFGSLLDQIRPTLSAMAYPISPRVYRAICRFVVSAEPVMSQNSAFDAQLAQRIVPRIRNLVTKAQLNGLDQLADILEASSVSTFEETLRLLEERKQSASVPEWDLDE